MAELAIIGLSLATVISYAMNRSLVSPVTILLGLFAGISVLANAQLYGLYAFDELAFEIVLAGGVALLVGSVFAKIFHAAAVQNPKKALRRSQENWRISYRFINGCLVLAILIMISTRAGSFVILASGGDLSDVRNYYLGYGGSSGFAASVGEVLGRLVVSPVLFISLPIFVYGLVEGTRKRSFNVLFAIAIMLNLVSSGGRIIFIYAVVQLLVMLTIRGRLKVRMGRGRAAMLICVLLAVVALVTISRGNALLFEAYTYFAIPLPLLAHWATVVDSNGIATNGSSMLYGVVTLVASIADVFGITMAQAVSEVVNRPQDQWVELLPGRPFNAFVTIFYYFYADFRLPGVVVFSAMYGFFVQTVYDRARSFGGARSKLLLLLTIQSIVMAFVRWQFTDGAYVLAFVLLFLVVRKSKGDNGDPDAGAYLDVRHGRGAPRARL